MAFLLDVVNITSDKVGILNSRDLDSNDYNIRMSPVTYLSSDEPYVASINFNAVLSYLLLFSIIAVVIFFIFNLIYKNAKNKDAVLYGSLIFLLIFSGVMVMNIINLS